MKGEKSPFYKYKRHYLPLKFLMWDDSDRIVSFVSMRDPHFLTYFQCRILANIPKALLLDENR